MGQLAPLWSSPGPAPPSLAGLQRFVWHCWWRRRLLEDIFKELVCLFLFELWRCHVGPPPDMHQLREVVL